MYSRSFASSRALSTSASDPLATSRKRRNSFEPFLALPSAMLRGDRKSTRLNSSHSQISYAVFCLKKKNVAPTSATDKDRYDDAARNIGPRDYQGWYDLAERTQRLAASQSKHRLQRRAQSAMPTWL